MHTFSTITCENCGWKGAAWFCANWTDNDSCCHECVDTSQRVGELWAPSHTCHECNGPASYPLPVLKEQQQIRAIAEATKDTLASGHLSLIVADEDLEGQSAYVVIVDASGAILAQREVVVGRNS